MSKPASISSQIAQSRRAAKYLEGSPPWVSKDQLPGVLENATPEPYISSNSPDFYATAGEEVAGTPLTSEPAQNAEQPKVLPPGLHNPKIIFR